MTTYYSNSKGMEVTADFYPSNSFSIEYHDAKCNCGTKTTGITVTDREDRDIIEKMILCDICTSKQKNKNN